MGNRDGGRKRVMGERREKDRGDRRRGLSDRVLQRGTEGMRVSDILIQRAVSGQSKRSLEWVVCWQELEEQIESSRSEQSNVQEQSLLVFEENEDRLRRIKEQERVSNRNSSQSMSQRCV